MKQSPQSKSLEEKLRSSKLVAGGFLGDDIRSLDEIITADLAIVASLGLSQNQIAERMQQLTDISVPALGNEITFEDRLIVVSQDYKGFIVCPWPHPGRFAKRITLVTDVHSGKVVQWTDLNIHFIAEHGFFEGTGAAFRIEPELLCEVIFPK